MVFKIIQISKDCLINWILMDFVRFSSEILTRESLSWRHEISWDCFSFKSLQSLSYPFSLLPSLSLLSFPPSLSLSSLFSLLSLSPLFPLSTSHKNKIKNKTLYWEYYDRECVVIISFQLVLKIHKIFRNLIRELLRCS